MAAMYHRVVALFLMLAGVSVLLGDQLIDPVGGANSYGLGVGLLLLGLMAVNHQLSRRASELRRRGASAPSAQ